MARPPLTETTDLIDQNRASFPFFRKIEPHKLNPENQIPHAYGNNKLEALKDKDKPAQTKIRIMSSGRCLFTVGTMSCSCVQGNYTTYPGTGKLDEQCRICSHPSSVHEDPLQTSGIARPKANEVPSTSIDWTPRPQVVTELFNRALKYRTILVRGTPASGKTVLMRLMHKHVFEQFPNYRVHIIMGWPQGMPHTESRSYIEQSIGGNPLTAKDTLVLIDDAQSSYYDDQLWSSFKVLERDSAIFVLFSSYGSPGRFPAEVKTGTPPLFCLSQRISLQQENCPGERPVGILLETCEARDLVSRYLLSQPTQPTLTDDFVDYLIAISGGHAGALAGLLQTIILDPFILAKCSRNGSKFAINLSDFIEVFQGDPTSKRLRKGLKQKRFARGLPARESLQHDLSIPDFLNEMVQKKTVEVNYADTSAFKSGARASYLQGWIHKSINNEKKEVYEFASPIHHWHCQALLRNHAPCKINAPSPLALVVDIIKHMKPSKLALPPTMPHMQSATLPPEDWYGKEFYSASEHVMNGGVLWSPEFGTKGVKGSGAIDFYLASNKWGVELTRDGCQLTSHYGRFQPGGNYHRWILDGELIDWVLLDFRSTIPKNKYGEFPKLFHICFSMEFSRVKVIGHNLNIIHEFTLLNK